MSSDKEDPGSIVRKRSEPRENSSLELDDDLACKDCGIVIPVDVVLLYEFDRCPECHLKHERERLILAFGTLDSVEAAQIWEVDSE